MMDRNRWLVKKPERDLIDKVILENNMSEILATILVNRGIIEKVHIDRFLNPNIHNLHDPFLMKDMNLAVDRIMKACQNHEKITIYGDYDVDGITSTSVLYMFLNEIGCYVDYYIPDRIKEGYGINKDALLKIKESGCHLIVSVDTGIVAVEEVLYAKTLGMDIIITDHHECQETLPDALAVLNPKRVDCDYPFDKLAGVGVTFKLIQAIAAMNNALDIIWKYLDIVAVGTIADIVPLQDENRVFTKVAFETIPNTWNVGLKALMKVADVSKDKITAGTVGFRIAPRLNAAGRLGDAKRAVELFITRDEIKAANIAESLNAENSKRQAIEQLIFKEAVDIIESTINIEKTKILVVASSGWNHGVIGIVASRITEKYYRPTILLTIEEGVASGSARSITGFSIFDALSSTKDVLDKFGGHDMAAGMSLNEANIDILRENLNLYAASVMTEETLIPKVDIDLSINIDDIDINFIEKISTLEPYGIGNAEPKFICSGKVKNIKQIGKQNNHLKINVMGDTKDIAGIGFNCSEYYDYLSIDNEIAVVCTLNINEWNQSRSPQLMIKDIKYSKAFNEAINQAIYRITHVDEIDLLHIKNNQLVPDRRHYEKAYRYLMGMDKQMKNTLSISKIMEGIAIQTPGELLKYLICLEVFKQIKLIHYEIHRYNIIFKLFKGKKVELNESKLYNKLL